MTRVDSSQSRPSRVKNFETRVKLEQTRVNSSQLWLDWLDTFRVKVESNWLEFLTRVNKIKRNWLNFFTRVKKRVILTRVDSNFWLESGHMKIFHFQIFEIWYQIFENLTKIELWRIFRFKYSRSRNFRILMVKISKISEKVKWLESIWLAMTRVYLESWLETDSSYLARVDSNFLLESPYFFRVRHNLTRVDSSHKKGESSHRVTSIYIYIYILVLNRVTSQTRVDSS